MYIYSHMNILEEQELVYERLGGFGPNGASTSKNMFLCCREIKTMGGIFNFVWIFAKFVFLGIKETTTRRLPKKYIHF